MILQFISLSDFFTFQTGLHANTAFGLVFALEHAESSNNSELADLISIRATLLFINDVDCPIETEPTDIDILSPCLNEADLLSRVLNERAFPKWLGKLLPGMFKEGFSLKPGSVNNTKHKLQHQSRIASQALRC